MIAHFHRAFLLAAALWATGFAAIAGEVPTDRIVVRLKAGGPMAAKAGSTREALAEQISLVTGERLRAVRTTGDGRFVMKLERRATRAQVAALAARLQQDPDVLEVLPDRIFVPSLTPNDTQYGTQWALFESQGIGAPAAWDLTTGSTGTVVAILDTGKLEHPDLAGRWVGGYDFVGDTNRSNDGTGRDTDATDPGDWVTAGEVTPSCAQTNSRWHGLAMAGIIAATGNNAQGVAGLDWNAKLLPVRVVGKCGGYESDIADGMRWAVGIAVPGVPANPNPAKVLNVSLEASGTCSAITQGAIDDAVSTGATVIASAGNNGTSVANYSPANCERVIAVGATNRLGRLPAYSNTGAQVTLSAPGGEGDGADAILTTFDSGTTSADLSGTYSAVNGTSASAAYVSGLVSLMLGANPTLLPEQIRFTLQANARPFPSDVLAGQANCNTSLCGAGIADGAVVRFAAAFGKGSTTPTVLAPSKLNGVGYGAGLRSDGQVFSWGLRASQRGDIADVRRLAGTAAGLLALKTDGTVWDLAGTATPVAGLDSIMAIAAGSPSVSGVFSLALRANGTVFAWGNNDFGQLGDGSTTSRATPSAVPGLSNVTAIAAGAAHALAVVGGEVWAWGWNGAGQLGDGTTTDRSTPAKITGLANVVAVHAGFEQSFAIRSDGTLWAWGRNDHGQLGDGSTTARSTPVQVTGITDVATVSTGGRHTFAIKTDGSLWGWGVGSLLMGLASSGLELVPVPVTSLGPVSAVGAGFEYSFAILADGRTVASGLSQGQLGIAASGCPSCYSFNPAFVVIGDNYTALFLDLFPPAFIPQGGIGAFGVPYESNSILTAGIIPGSAITVTNGEYSIDDGPWSSAPGTISNGQGVRVRVVTPGCGATLTATVTIAGAPHRFSVTTIDCDTTPDPLGSFVNQVSAAPGSTATSNAITVTGITSAVPISVTGGEYSIGCNGTFTSAAGLVGSGQSVCVRLVAPATADTYAEAILTVASLTTTFRVVTDQVGLYTAPMIFTGASLNQTGSGFALRSDGRLFGFGLRAVELGGIPRMRKIAAAPGVVFGLRADGTVWQGTAPVAGLAGITALSAGGRYPGEYYVLALTGSGSVLAFGDNTYGQLGDGTTTSRAAPAAVPGLSNVTALSAAMTHALAVVGGEVWAWGSNNSGQLGDGTTTDRSTPAKIAGLSNVVAVHAGWQQSFAIKSDGTLWAWGRNDHGQLGDGSTTARSTPVQVTGITDVATVSTGGRHTFAIKSDGSLWGWGVGSLLLGLTSSGLELVPVPVTSLGPVSAVSAGFEYSFAILADGRTVASGLSQGQLGIAADGCPSCYSFSPAGVVIGNNYTLLILDLFPPVFITATDVGFGAIQQSGEITAAGIAANSPITVTGGEYSIDDGPWSSAPGTLSNGQRVRVQVLSGGCGTTRTVTVTIAGVPRSFSASTVACDTDPEINGGLGQPVNVTPGSVVTSGALVVNGINGSIPVSASPGAQYSVGCTASYTSTPGLVGPNQSVCLRVTAPATEDTVAEASITIGPYTLSFRLVTDQVGFYTAPMIHTGARLNQTGSGYALRSDGRLFGFGVRAFALEGIPRMRKIAAGPGLLLGLRADGTVWQGTAPVAGLTGITAIAAGGRYPGETFGLALTGSGSLLAFGNNAYGQLGDGTTTSRTTPAAVPGLSNVTAIAAGAGHALAVVGGEVWAWGWNDQGQLGDGTTTDRSTPAKIAGLANVIAVHAGWRQSFAIKSDGTLWAWGLNDHGQLGDGTLVSRSTPVQVTGITDVATVSTGGRHTFAIKSDGSLWGWGVGSLLMGLASTALELVPVPVTSLGPVSAVSAGWEYSFAILADGRTVASGLNQSQLGIGADGCTSCYSFSPGGVVIGNNFTPLILDLFPTVFIPATDVGFGAPQESSEITAAGIAPNSPITVTGGEYSIDGGPWTSAPGTLSNGQRVRLQVLSGGCGTTSTVTVTIAGVPRSFSASTVACDTDPQINGDLGQPVNVTPGSVVTSGALVVNGINGSIPVSASPGAQYSVGCTASYTSTPGLVGPNQSVCLRVTAPATEDTVAEASITIGPYTVSMRLITAKPGFTTTPAVLAPSRFNQTGGGIGLSSDGRVYTWGLRAGLRTDISGVTKIAAADGLWLALRADGTVWNITGRAIPIPGLSNITAIGAGARYSPASFGLALKSDGTVWAWGYNAFGQLGDGSTVDRAAPAAIAGLANVTAIAAGMGHGLAVIGGEVWAWGWNDQGQLGIGSASPATCTSADFTDVPCAKAPVKVPGLANVVSVHAGWRQSFAIKSDGTLWAWGHNDHAQLGDGSTTARSTPVQVTGIAGVATVSTGGRHTFAIKGDGSLWGWGVGSLLMGFASTALELVPVPVTSLGPVSSVSAGWDYSFAIVAEGYVVAAGLNQGQLGIAADGCTSCYSFSPAGVVGAGNVPLVLVVGGLKPDPFAFNAVFGAPLSTTIVSNPVTVSGLGNASPVTVEGGEYSVNGSPFANAPGFVSNGDTVRVRVASSGAYEAVTSSRLTIGGAVGFANTFFVYTRRDPSLPATIPGVSLGESHSAYLNASGLVFAFGYNGNGQLGNGTTTGSSRPMPVPGVAGISSFSSGANHILAARSDGTVLAWGFNGNGQVGDGTTATRLTAFTVPGLAFVKQVSAGRHHSLALRADGSVLAWGLNSEGQVGDGTATAQRLSPVAVAGLASGITAIAAGGRHSLALRTDGTVLAWGANDSGQLGDGTTTLRRSPTLVSGLTGVVAIAAGGAHSLALKADGTLWAWGANGFGQLGLGDNASRSSPVQVTALGGNVGLVAAGESHTLAVKAGGQLFTWGNNANSQLGDAANTNRNLPFALASPANIVAISGGGRHSAALDSSRRLFVFGDNFFGQVGNRSGNFSPLSGSLNVLAGDSVISTGASGTGSGVGTGSGAGSAVIDLDGFGGGFDFGSRAAGSVTAVAATYRNVSATGSITDLVFEVTGGAFAIQSDTCSGNTLGPDQSCGFSILFAPTVPGVFEGELVLNSNLVGSPERRSLSGSGAAPASPAIAFAKSGLAFAPQAMGTASVATYPVTNTGTATLSLGNITSPLAAFSASHDCASVAPGAGCTITVTFLPTIAQAMSAVLPVPSNVPGPPPTITVSGTGVASTGGITTQLLTLTKAGTGSGNVTSNPAGIDCGGACVQAFPAGTVVTLSATPLPGSYFTGWSGDCIGTGSCTLAMAAARGVVAHFTTQPAAIPRLGNISTRGQVLTGNDVMIGGFIIGGSVPKTVVIRARGPSLIPFGIPNALANPRMDLYSGPAIIASNDNWGDDAANAASITATGLAPTNPFESAIRATLTPGAYTAIVTGVGNATGVGIVEVFEVDRPETPLANISTRGQVLTVNDVMIGGFIIQGDQPQTVVVRARGPSLAPFGIPNALADPVLTLVRQADQAVIATNDDWQSQAIAADGGAIQSSGFAPTDAKEAAIRITLPPGTYTAIVTGKNGTTGVGIVEVFAQ